MCIDLACRWMRYIPKLAQLPLRALSKHQRVPPTWAPQENVKRRAANRRSTHYYKNSSCSSLILRACAYLLKRFIPLSQLDQTANSRFSESPHSVHACSLIFSAWKMYQLSTWVSMIKCVRILGFSPGKDSSEIRAFKCTVAICHTYHKHAWPFQRQIKRHEEWHSLDVSPAKWWIKIGKCTIDLIRRFD